MPTPLDLLRAIRVELDAILTDVTAFQPQQVTFIQHIQKTTDTQLAIFEPMPDTAYALQRILPTFGDTVLNQQAALFGYARLLLESPESFDGATVPDKHHTSLSSINQHGQQLYQLTQQIIQQSETDRRVQHQAPAETLNIAEVIDTELPILQYLLRQDAVQLTATVDPIETYLSRYHLVALIQHIILTLGRELIEYGHIKLSTQAQSLIIFCTGIQLTQSDIETLFTQQGRYHYPRRFEQAGGTITFTRERGRGATIVLNLPQPLHNS